MMFAVGVSAVREFQESEPALGWWCLRRMGFRCLLYIGLVVGAAIPVWVFAGDNLVPDPDFSSGLDFSPG